MEDHKVLAESEGLILSGLLFLVFLEGLEFACPEPKHRVKLRVVLAPPAQSRVELELKGLEGFEQVD